MFRGDFPEVIDRCRHVVEGARVSAALITDAPVLWRPGSYTVGREGNGEVADVVKRIPVAPETPVDDHNHRVRPLARGKAQVGKVLRSRTVLYSLGGGR